MKVFTAAAIAALIVPPAGAQTKNEMKELYATVLRNNFYKSCLAKQRAAPENFQLSGETIVKFCGCVMEHLPEIITFEEATSSKHPKNRNFPKQLDDAAMACADKVVR